MQYALRTSLTTGLAAFTSVAWDHGASSLRLATGSVDGTVIIWTAAPPPVSQSPEDLATVNLGRIVENAPASATTTPETTSPPSGSPPSSPSAALF